MNNKIVPTPLVDAQVLEYDAEDKVLVRYLADEGDRLYSKYNIRSYRGQHQIYVEVPNHLVEDFQRSVVRKRVIASRALEVFGKLGD